MTPDRPEGPGQDPDPSIDPDVTQPLPKVEGDGADDPSAADPDAEGSSGTQGEALDADRTIAHNPNPPTGQDQPATRVKGTRGGGRGEGENLKLNPAEAALIGKQLGGCQIHQLLGRGAMGSVFRATQVHLDREVAVKTIRPDMMLNDSVLHRFRGEGLSQSRFTSPYVVPVYEAGEQDGTFYLVMRYVSGGTLRAYTEKLPNNRLPEPEALRFLLQCVEGLKEAQVHNILHRDIKPDNILLDEQGRAMLGDFGIAKMLDSGIDLTQSMDHVGTPLYMSPEQCRADELDFRTDMYSLGATFFYLVTNLPPAKGSSILELIQTKTSMQYLSPAQALPDFENTTPLSRVIERMTALEREHRYGSWEELEDDLRAAMKGGKTKASGVRRALEKPGARTKGTRGAQSEVQGAGGGKRVLVASLLVLAGLGAAGGYGFTAGWFDGLLGEGPGHRDEAAGGSAGAGAKGDTDGSAANPGQVGGTATSEAGYGDSRDPEDRPSTDGDPADLTDGGGGTGDAVGAEGPGSDTISSDSERLGTAAVEDTPPSGTGPEIPDSAVEDRAPVVTQPPVEPVDDVDSYNDAVVRLAEWGRAFQDAGPTTAVIDGLNDFIRKGHKKINHPDTASLRTDYVALSRAVEKAANRQQELGALTFSGTPTPPFNALERYLDSLRRIAGELEVDGKLPQWATTAVRDRADLSLFTNAEDSLQAGVEDISGVIQAGLQSSTAQELRRAAASIGSLKDGQIRLVQLLTEVSSIRRMPSTMVERVEAVAPRLSQQEQALARLLELVGVRDGIRGLAAQVDGVTTLQGWRTLNSTGDQTLEEQLNGLLGDKASPQLSRELGLLKGGISRWIECDGRIQDAAREIAGGGSLAKVAARLDAAEDKDRAAGQNTPSDMKLVLAALDATSRTFRELARTADLDAAVRSLDAALSGSRGNAIEALLTGPAATRILGAEEALKKLQRVAQGMVPVPAGTVLMEWEEGRTGTQQSEKEVAAFLISPTEVSHGDWLRFLEASAAPDFAQVRTNIPGVWPNESTWQDAMQRLVEIRGLARSKGDHPVDRVPFPEAMAYAAWRQCSLPTQAQWWLIARGPRGSSTAFPWGDQGRQRSAPLPSDSDLLAQSSRETVPVAEGGRAFRGSKLGKPIHHLAGNVEEWLQGPADMTRPRAIGGGYRIYRSRGGPADKKKIFAGSKVMLYRQGARQAGVGLRLACSPQKALAESWLE